MGLLEKVAGSYASRANAFVKSGGSYGAPGGAGQTLGSLQFSSIVGFGDSITEATAFSLSERWLNIVGTALGATSVFNRGLSGTVLQNSNVAAGTPSPNNGLDRYATTNYGIVGANRRKLCPVALGFNDARYTAGDPGTFNVANYIADYHELIAKMIDAGYTPDTICVVGPYYITDTGLQSGSAGFTGQTRAGFEAFVAGALAVAQAHNTWYCDPYAYMRDNGGASLIGADFYHPNALGQSAIAQCVLGATRANTRTQPVLTVSSPAPGTVNWSIASTGAQSYTVEYMLAGGSTFTGTSTGAATSGQFTGLTPGYVNVRVRADYADGSSGWVYKRLLAADAVAFRMTFTGAAGTAVTDLTPEAGGALVAQTGYAPATPSVTDGNGAAYSTTTAGVYRSNMTPLGPNYRIDAVIKYLSAVTGDNCGITFNASDSANTFYFVSPFRADNTLRAYRNANGSNTMQPSPPSRPFNSGNLSLQIFVRDTVDGPKQIDVYEVGNSTPLISFTDATPITGGSWGIRDACVKAAGTGWHIDEMTVTYIDALAS